MERAPFRDETFDAMFYQDADVEISTFKAALRVVKRGGIVIFSDDDCGDGRLPFKSQHFYSFEKIK